MVKDIKPLLVSTITQAVKDHPAGDWSGSPFEDIFKLSADVRGEVGEQLCASILRNNGFTVPLEQLGKTESFGGRSYDFTVNGVPVEVKLATRGRNANTFQHENLSKERGWEILVIIDVAPNDIYVEIKGKKDLPWNEMHRRKDGSIYKYDLSIKKHEERKSKIKTTDEFVKRFQKTLNRVNSTEYKRKKK